MYSRVYMYIYSPVVCSCQCACYDFSMCSFARSFWNWIVIHIWLSFVAQRLWWLLPFLFVGGRRAAVSLSHILQFVPGAEEGPVLGFVLHPSLQFVEVTSSFIPTANTCINCLNLPRPSLDIPLLTEDKLFNLYDFAFSNAFFGHV